MNWRLETVKMDGWPSAAQAYRAGARIRGAHQPYAAGFEPRGDREDVRIRGRSCPFMKCAGQVGICRPLSLTESILPLFVAMSMMENPGPFFAVQNLLWPRMS